MIGQYPAAEASAGVDPSAVRTEAARAIASDPATVALLEKHGAWKAGSGPRPTPQELGKLGAFAKWLKKPFGNSVPAPGSAPGTAGHAAPVATLAPDQTPDRGLVAPDIDEGLCRRIFTALLERGDGFAVQFIENEARLAGATDEQLAKYRVAAALSANDKKLLIELAPDFFRELGIDPRQFAVWTVVGVIGFHGVSLWNTTRELREERRAQDARRERERKADRSTPDSTPEAAGGNAS